MTRGTASPFLSTTCSPRVKGNRAPANPGCDDSDLDDDNDVDLSDFGVFSGCFNGPNRPPASPDCVHGLTTWIDGDADGDGDVDLADFGAFSQCFNGPNRVPAGAACDDSDLDEDNDVDLSDFGVFSQCFNGPNRPPASPDCVHEGPAGAPPSGAPAGDELPPSGTFALHGRPVDVLSDGLVLIPIRARTYDPRHGRWLQRDPLGYADGPNLYEAFGGNATAFTDPMGTQVYGCNPYGDFGTERDAHTSANSKVPPSPRQPSTKLWSTWVQGADVYWQHIYLWCLTQKPHAEFYVGKYYSEGGNQFVIYDRPLESGDYHYMLSREQLDRWARSGVHEEFDYQDFVRLYAVAFDPMTGEPVERSYGEDIQRFFEIRIIADEARLDRMARSFDPVNAMGGLAHTGVTGYDVVGNEGVAPRYQAAALGITALEIGGPYLVRQIRLARASIRLRLPRVARYGRLAGELSGTGQQAGHLNQNAVYGSVIPRDEGVATAMRGNAFLDAGSPHFEFHAELECFWAPYRRGGSLYGSLPANAQYGAAVERAAIRAGYSPAEAAHLARQAAAQRAAYGLSESAPVLRIPGRLPQSKP